MIAVDTNILVYAHREEAPWHDRAAEVVRALAEGGAPWAIPWPCVHEVLAKLTHPGIFAPPTPVERALEFVSELAASPSLVLLAEGPEHLATLAELLRAGRVTGARVHDARIAALCLQHGVSELLSADRDFGRFPRLTVRNPLVA